MKNFRLIGLLLLVSLSLAICGCSKDADKASTSMGPMPTAPPSGSPYASASSSGVSPDEFVTKLQGLSKSDRAAYMKQNQAVMNSILGSPQDSPAKQKLMTMISQH